MSQECCSHEPKTSQKQPQADTHQHQENDEHDHDHSHASEGKSTFKMFFPAIISFLVDTFVKDYNSGAYENLRFGQAFFHVFDMCKMKEQYFFKDLYEGNKEDSMRIIQEHFEFS